MLAHPRFPAVVAWIGLILIAPAAVRGQASLRFATPQGEVLASGFVVSAEGYVAASFHAAQNATACKLVGERGRTYDVAGWVAADKGRDLLILALKNPPKEIVVAAMNPAGPAAGEEVLVVAGPLSRPLLQQWAANATADLEPPPVRGALPAAAVAPAEVPTLLIRRRLSGAELWAGLPPRDEDAPGQSPSMDCLVVNLGFDTSYAGALVGDRAGRSIYGMLTGITDADQRLRVAVGVREIIALLPQQKIPPKPLAQLKKYEDALDPAAPAAANAVAATQYHLPLADRFDAYVTRLIEAERALAKLRKTTAVEKSALIDLRGRIDKIATTIIDMAPEETFTEVVTRTVRDVGRDGKVTVRTERENVTRRRFSARQLAQQSELNKERIEVLWKLRSQWFVYSHDDKFERPLAERRLERGRRELFYLADPFELRSEDEHRALVDRLDEAIAEGGAPGMFFLARGLAKLRLRKLAEAAADFRDAEDVDGALQQLVLAAEGRRLILDGDVSKGTATISKAIKGAPNDAAVQFLAARGELDKKAYLQASRGLTAALEKGADRAETHAALAWLHATTSAGDATNGRLAVTHARQACFATEDNDWLSLAALGAAYARTSEFERASAALERAKALAPAEAQDQCDLWKSAVEAKQPLEREWR